MEFNAELAREYEKGVRRTLPTYDAMFKMVQSYLRMELSEEASILIIGAGGGTEIEVLSNGKPHWRFTGLDPSEDMLSIAEYKVVELGIDSRVTLLNSSVEEFESDSRFDAATCLLVLHFVEDREEKLRMLKIVSGCLKKGSPFILASMFGDPDEPEFKEKIILWRKYWLDRTNLSHLEMDQMEEAIRNLSIIPEEEIRALLEEAGFLRITKFMETAFFGGWICYKL